MMAREASKMKGVTWNGSNDAQHLNDQHKFQSKENSENFFIEKREPKKSDIVFFET